MNSTKNNGQNSWFSSRRKTSLSLKTSVGTLWVPLLVPGALLVIATTTGGIAKYISVDVSTPTKSSYGNFHMLDVTEVDSNTPPKILLFHFLIPLLFFHLYRNMFEIL